MTLPFKVDEKRGEKNELRMEHQIIKVGFGKNSYFSRELNVNINIFTVVTVQFCCWFYHLVLKKKLLFWLQCWKQDIVLKKIVMI